MDSFGDVLGFVLFLLFLGASLVGKLAKRENNRRTQMPQQPRWPGPVAGPQGRGFPQPSWPSPQQPPAFPQPMPRAPAPPAAQDADRGEGVQTEGYGVEGPAPNDQVEQELSRFTNETDRFSRQEIDEVVRFTRESEQFERRQLTELRTSLGKTTEAATVTSDDGFAAPDVSQGLADPASLAQAFVLAEVLGKPKAMRSGWRM